MKTIQFLTHNYHPITENYLKGFTPKSSGIIDDYKLVFNQKVAECDYLVVFDHLPADIMPVKCSVKNTILILGEGKETSHYSVSFKNQFSHVITCQKDLEVKGIKFVHALGLAWFPLRTYDELKKTSFVEKTKDIVIIISNRTETELHRKRIDFCLKLKEYFGDKIDFFGRGFHEFHDKWDVLAPYKYAITIENAVEDHWITEKLTDCFVTHTYPFYYGCPNVGEYYDANSYSLIDIDNFEKTCNHINDVLNDSTHYQHHLDSVIQSKNAYMDKYLLFPMVVSYIENHLKNQVSLPKEKLNFRQNDFGQVIIEQTLFEKVKGILSKLF